MSGYVGVNVGIGRLCKGSVRHSLRKLMRAWRWGPMSASEVTAAQREDATRQKFQADDDMKVVAKTKVRCHHGQAAAEGNKTKF